MVDFLDAKYVLIGNPTLNNQLFPRVAGFVTYMRGLQPKNKVALAFGSYGWRPGVVFQNNMGNAYSPNIIALPLTSSLKKTNQPTHVIIKAADSGLRRDSMVLCENPERMSKERLGQYITTLSEEHMKQVAEANLLATGAIAYLDIEALLAVWKKAAALNAVVPA